MTSFMQLDNAKEIKVGDVLRIPHKAGQDIVVTKIKNGTIYSGVLKENIARIDDLMIKGEIEALTKRKQKKTGRINNAEKLAELTGGRVWAPKGNDGPVRVYIGKGYADILDGKVNIDGVPSRYFEEFEEAATQLGLTAYRA